MSTRKVYFPALDGIRAIAVLLVFAGHFAGQLSYFRPDSDTLWLRRLSAPGLVLFFVLSGFLITYLLLAEAEQRRSIDIRGFYVRRILRIWPLYYLIVCMGLFLLPYTGVLGFHEADLTIRENLWQTAPWYLLFLPNYAGRGLPINIYIHHTWSIGTEEQFYLLWPWAVRMAGRRFPALLFGLISLALLSAVTLTYAFADPLAGSGWMHMLRKAASLFYWSNAGCFSLGGLMAYCYLKRPGIVRFLCGKALQAGALLLVPVLIGVVFSTPERVLSLALLFSLLILQATQDGTLLYRLRGRALLHIGKVSYGMYIFHVIMIFFAGRCLLAVGGGRLPGWLFAFLAFVLGLALTITAGTLSFRFIESYFLRLKQKWQAGGGRFN